MPRPYKERCRGRACPARRPEEHIKRSCYLGPNHRLPVSASPGCRLPILCPPCPGRTDEPTSAHFGLRSSDGSACHQLPDPSTSDREPSAPDEPLRHRQRFRQVQAFHLPIGPASEFPTNCRPSPKSYCHHKLKLARSACRFAARPAQPQLVAMYPIHHEADPALPRRGSLGHASRARAEPANHRLRIGSCSRP